MSIQSPLKDPSTRIRALFVVPNLGTGGAETQLVALANGLPSSQFKKYIFCFEERFDLLPRLIREEVHFSFVKRERKFDIAPARAIAALIDREHIDVVHCTLQMALLMGWLGTLIAKRRVKLVVALHTTIPRSRKIALAERWIFRWPMKRADQCIFVCQTQADYRIRQAGYLSGKSSVIHNGIDAGHFAPSVCREEGQALRRKLQIPEGSSVVCNIAGFRPEKGHRLLLDAFEIVIASGVDAYLLLAGDGSLRREFEELVKCRGQTDRVRFLGNQADVRPVLAASDVATIASNAVETFSLAMLEAMAMGLPLVATDIGGTCEAVVVGRTGWLVPVDDVKVYAKFLCEALNNRQITARLGESARQLVVERFSDSVMINQTADLLRTLVGK